MSQVPLLSEQERVCRKQDRIHPVLSWEMRGWCALMQKGTAGEFLMVAWEDEHAKAAKAPQKLGCSCWQLGPSEA